MQRNLELEYGKVINYNGYDGTIKGIDGNNYFLKKNNIIEEKLETGDLVVFEKEIINNLEIEDIQIARFVKKLKKTPTNYN